MRKLEPALTLSALAIGMLILRVLRTHSFDRAFLVWNLALAWAPVLFAHLAIVSTRRRRTLTSIAALGVWWIFFPNAIYLVTDLVYVGSSFGVLRWCDAAMLGAFAFAGATIAVGSLESMRALVADAIGSWLSWGFTALVWVSTGIGVWLGRVRRWNSWDAVLAPENVVRDVVHLVLAPRSNAGAWIIALAFAALLAALQLAAVRAGVANRRM
jgi:uncharacterized membrane protein